MPRKKILFIVEGLTFAHVSRSAVLAKALQLANYEVHFACRIGEYQDKVSGDLDGITLWTLTHHIKYADFVSKMSQGQSPYSRTILRAYVEEEMNLFRLIDPDIVIGDLRYSLSISCARASKVYVNLVNAIWSPFTQQRYIVPEGQLTRTIGPILAALIFELGNKIAFQKICKPFNQLRSELGLAPFKDVFELHCAGDLNLYLDPPDIFNTSELPPNHQFIGPVLHSLSAAMPDVLNTPVNDFRPPLVFATLGSSGAIDCLPSIVRCLERMPVRAVVATCGRTDIVCEKETTILKDFLPAREVIRKARLVISNGGSPISYLAMSEGVPVIAVCSNMDQHLTAQALAQYGAAISIRAENVRPNVLRRLIHSMITMPGYRERAQLLSKSIAAQNTIQNFLAAIERVCSKLDKSSFKRMYCLLEPVKNEATHSSKLVQSTEPNAFAFGDENISRRITNAL